MDNNQYYETMGYPTCSPIAGYPTADLESMYPDIYNRIYPKVRHMCMVIDHPHNPGMYPCPRREIVQGMTDDIYMEIIREMGGQYENWDAMAQQQIPGYGPGFGPGPGYGPGYGPGIGGQFGPGGFLRDIISIILIRELLSRRRRRFY